MSNRDLAAGVFRAWGVMWSIYVLLALPQVVSVFAQPSQFGEKGIATFVLRDSTITLGCRIIIVVFLIVKAGWLSRVVFPDEQALGLSLSVSEFSGVLLAVVGLYFLIDGVRNACGSAYLLLTKPRDSESSLAYLWQRQPENLARSLGGTLAGALVFFGVARRHGFWKSIRDAYRDRFGLQESSDEE